jgi:hypothetical protein
MAEKANDVSSDLWKATSKRWFDLLEAQLKVRAQKKVDESNFIFKIDTKTGRATEWNYHRGGVRKRRSGTPRTGNKIYRDNKEIAVAWASDKQLLRVDPKTTPRRWVLDDTLYISKTGARTFLLEGTPNGPMKGEQHEVDLSAAKRWRREIGVSVVGLSASFHSVSGSIETCGVRRTIELNARNAEYLVEVARPRGAVTLGIPYDTLKSGEYEMRDWDDQLNVATRYEIEVTEKRRLLRRVYDLSIVAYTYV